MLELTLNYLENPYADVYVYFSSSRFDCDLPNNDALISGYHGQSLCNWLHQKLTAEGYTVLAVEPNSASWTFVYVNCQYRWDVLCENIIRHHTSEWKITINSKAKDELGAGGVPPLSNVWNFYSQSNIYWKASPTFMQSNGIGPY